jgi:hypothetical protein
MWEAVLSVTKADIQLVTGSEHFSQMPNWERSLDGGKTWKPCEVEKPKA